MQLSDLIRIWIATALLLMVAKAQGQTHAGQYEQADIEYGASLYASHCIACHGETGDLMPQINLRSGRFPNAPTDRELRTVISDGLPGTAMTPNEYNDSEITALIAFVRNIGNFSLSDAVLGDADNGQRLYEGKGECEACHRIAGRGPRFAPDLSSVGANRTAAALERALLGGSDATLPINRPVRIVTAEGRTVTGRRLNEDTFTVQIVTPAERLLSLDKSTLREFTILDAPEMPSYRDRLSEDERADVVAYLLSLKGTN